MNFFPQKFETFRDLYINELRDLYSAEMQLVKALPKMADAATSADLKQAFANHLEETFLHVERLEYLLQNLSEDAGGETCEGMKGLIKEGENYVRALGDDEIRDVGLIAAAQRVEHYEIAAYGTARALALRVGDTEAAATLQMTLDEEGAADHRLTEIAESYVNTEAAATGII